MSGISLFTVAGAVPDSHRLPDYPVVSLGENGTLKPRDYKERKGRGQLTDGEARVVRRRKMRVKLTAS